MDILGLASTLLEIAKPQGMWEGIIFGLEGFIKNYGWTIILLTVLIKIVMLPFDYFNRYVSKKNAAKMAIVQPEIEKINKRYAGNKDMINQKTMECYKKNNYSVMGSCGIMLVNLVFTAVIFFTLFAGLNKMAEYKIATEFTTLQSVYEQTYTEALASTENTGTTAAEKEAFATQLAKTETITAYDTNVRQGFLWIKNIWRPDTNASVVLSYKDYLKLSKTKEENLTEADYNKIMQPISEKYNGWNGYYILIVLSAIVTFLSTQIPNWMGKAKAKRTGKPNVDPMAQNKILIYLMPIIMALFTLFYNAMFAIYIVAGAIFGMISNPLITLLVEHMYEKSVKKEEEKRKAKISYSRKG